MWKAHKVEMYSMTDYSKGKTYVTTSSSQGQQMVPAPALAPRQPLPDFEAVVFPFLFGFAPSVCIPKEHISFYLVWNCF